MNQRELADLIHRVSNGRATPEEVERLEAYWRDAQHDDSFLKEHTTDELEQIGAQMFARVHAHIHENQAPVRRLWAHTWMYRAAAVALILLSVSIWFYASQNSLTEVRTAFGERVTVTLPDESTVVLNGNSVLRYAKGWTADAPREIWIEGEGFFSVQHKSNDQKFLVHADELDVEVLGTKFNVKARPCVSEVMLTEGKVKLAHRSAESEAIFLKPGELATLDSDGVSKRTVSKEHFTSWVDNKLYFDRTPLRDIAQMLKETYGLNVQFQVPELAKLELSGEISSATEEDILYAITETFNLEYVKDGQSVVISEKSN